jgi:acyl carrier protein
MSEVIDSEMDAILEIIKRVSGLATVTPDEDFYDAGVASVQALPLLLDLESEFNVTISDEQFLAARSARALHQMIAVLRTK